MLEGCITGAEWSDRTGQDELILIVISNFFCDPRSQSTPCSTRDGMHGYNTLHSLFTPLRFDPQTFHRFLQ